PNSTAVLQSPVATQTISFLGSSGNGAVTIAYTVHHADNSTESGTFVVPDWFGGANQALTVNGRVDVNSRTFSAVGSNDPRLYSIDVNLSNATSPVTSIDLSRNAGNGHAAIFAISTLIAPNDNYAPATITGYNKDMIVEADAAHPLTTGLNATTATMDRGTGNTNTTWFEQGYYAPLPSAGLPAPGSLVVALNAADHTFKMPDSYTAPNAILIDSTNSGTFTLTTPTAYTAISFLGAAGGGATTIGYTLHYTDSTTQTGTFVTPDWFSGPVVAINANGRVDVSNGVFSAVNATPNNPRLYPIDLAVNQPSTPIASIDFVQSTGNGHVALMAVSATAGAVKPIFDTQPAATKVTAGSTVQLTTSVSGTAPLSYQWQRGTNGVYVNVSEGGKFTGATAGSLTINPAATEDSADYILVAQNVGGSTTSQVARVSVLSSTPNILSPSDTISLVGGSAPSGENASFAIDGTTSKYLNFGNGGNNAAPFVGPVGLLVTPASGSTVVTGLRIFTANDGSERDPIDYKLEGSTDGGTTFSVISAGTLSPSTARNAGGLTINPLTQVNQEILFSNNSAYTTYQATFTHVRSDASANSLQIGEIQLLGVPGTATGATLTFSRETANGPLTITSSAPGTLQSTTELKNSGTVWDTVGPINGSVTVSTTAVQTFYRVVP
ncbi:MAG: Immunoglobulin I-set domain protein, partial [Verrucomicrobiales bacterium]|nr:Immunoglobulin I-set domain protein [Verrucomicrobiales bacterium]